MTVFLLKRAAQLVLLSLMVVLVTFLLSSLVPGDYFSARLLDPTVRAETIEHLRQAHGLNDPVYVQYGRWMKNLLRLDLGYSLFYQRPVLAVVADALAKTLWMGIPALVLGFGIGISLGTFHGMCARGPAGRVLDFLSSVFLSLPSLLLGLAALLFAAHTGWFPLGGMSSAAGQFDKVWQLAADRMRHLVLPVACLTLPVAAYVERIQYAATRGSREALYVRFARARGLSRARIFLQYFLRPGLNPVLSISGPMIGGILSGSLVLEVIFAWPGIGQITYDALFNRDVFLLAGCVVASSVLLVAGNLLGDIALRILDPRTRSLS